MISLEVVFPKMKLRAKPGVMEKVAAAVARGLDRQAKAGLGPARRGGQITLHGGHLAEIWKRVGVNDQGDITFDHALAYLIEQYGAGDLKPRFLAEVEAEVEPILSDGLELVEE